MESKKTDKFEGPKSRRLFVTVVITCGLVALLSAILGIVLLLPSRISADNYLKIKLGMAEAEVNALLGEPDSVEHLDEIPPLPLIGGAPKRDVFEYGTGKRRIKVVYANQRVYRKYFVEVTDDPSQPKVIDTRGY